MQTIKSSKSSSSENNSQSISKAPISREGNRALEIVRPLLEQGATLAFMQIKNHLIEKTNNDVIVDSLPPLCFLDTSIPVSVEQDTVILSSYPRSGNTLLRAYLEKILGLVTGSDCDIDKKLN